MKKITENTKVTLTLKQLKKLVKESTGTMIVNLPPPERVHLFEEFWDTLDGEGYTTKQYLAWLEARGYDTTGYDGEMVNRDADMAGFDDEGGEDEGVEGINSKEEAAAWLRKNTDKYGNTRFFPPEERQLLNKLIEKFGNTYFWNKINEDLEVVDDPTFDISAAIKSGNYKIQGIRGDKPNPVNVRMFAICMYQKSEKGWLNLNLVFDMAYAWAMFYDGNRKKDRPWDERRIGSKDGSLLIDDSLVEELKSNPDLHKAIEDHVEYCCKGNAVDEKKDMVFQKLENLKVSGTNRFAQSAIDTSNHEKALKDAVEYCKATYPEIVGGHSTQWYDQGGPGDPWDYDGDDDLSLERTFEIFDIDSKEKVDALAKAGKMSKTVNKGNFSTTYRVVFKK